MTEQEYNDYIARVSAYNTVNSKIKAISSILESIDQIEKVAFMKKDNLEILELTDDLRQGFAQTLETRNEMLIEQLEEV